MRYNSKGDYAAGVGGDGHFLSINKIPVLPAPSSNIGWITDNEVASNRDGFAVIIAKHLNGSERVLYTGPSLTFRVGGGRWAVEQSHGVWLLDTGERIPTVECFGLDGTLATWTWEGGGLALNGTEVEHGHVSGVQIYHRNCYRYQLDGGVIRCTGLPLPVTLPGVAMNLRMTLHEGKWWCLYQSTHTGTLVAHPYDSLMGYHLTSPGENAFRPDICSVGRQLRACWASVESEFPHQQHEVNVLDYSLVDLNANPVPTPVPTPEPEPEPMPEPGSLLDLVTEIYNKRPHSTNDDFVEIVNEVAWIERDGGWGLSKKASGNHGTRHDGTPVAYDILHHKPSDTLWDCFGPSEAPVPKWGEAHPHNDPNRPWIAPIKPQDAPGPGPGPTPTPSPCPDCNVLAGRLDALERAIDALSEVTGANTEAIVGLAQKPPTEYVGTVEVKGVGPLNPFKGHGHSAVVTITPKS